MENSTPGAATGNGLFFGNLVHAVSVFAGQNKKVFLADPLLRSQWQPSTSNRTENLLQIPPRGGRHFVRP